MKPTFAIDPGASGGIAYCDPDGIIRAMPMPDGMTAQCDIIRELAMDHYGVIMERVGGYRPGNSGPAAATFARHCGHLEAACYTAGLPVKQVAPRTWQQAMGPLPKDKGDRKRAIREAMQRRYPHIKVTLKTADALGMLVWEGPQS